MDGQADQELAENNGEGRRGEGEGRVTSPQRTRNAQQGLFVVNFSMFIDKFFEREFSDNALPGVLAEARMKLRVVQNPQRFLGDVLWIINAGEKSGLAVGYHVA